MKIFSFVRIVTQWLSIEGFFGTLTPVVTNIMMALELKRNVLKRLLVCTLIKGLTMVPLVWILGFPGAVISSTLGYLYLLYYNFKEIHKVYGINYHKTGHYHCSCLYWNCRIMDHFIIVDTDWSRWSLKEEN